MATAKKKTKTKETKPRRKLTIAEKQEAIAKKKESERKRKVKARNAPRQKEIKHPDPKNAKKTCTYSEIEAWTKKIGAVPPAVRCYVEDPHFGRLGHFDFLPSLADLKKEFGEGRFKLKIHRPNDRGGLVYAACRTVEVS